jgi:hypothetical protein
MSIAATIAKWMADDGGRWWVRETRDRERRERGKRESERHWLFLKGGNRWKWPFLPCFSYEAIRYEKGAQSARNSWQIKHNIPTIFKGVGFFNALCHCRYLVNAGTFPKALKKSTPFGWFLCILAFAVGKPLATSFGSCVIFTRYKRRWKNPHP